MAALALFFQVACERGDTVKEPLPDLPARVTPTDRAMGEVRPVRRLDIAFVAEVRGEIDPCGCPTLPYGGFERRAGFLRELRAGPDPVFHLDAGQLLVQGFETGGRGSRSERAQLMLDLSTKVGLDAWSPGPADLVALGPDGLKDTTAVSATWTDLSGTLLLSPLSVLERDGVKVAVIGLSDAPPTTTGVTAADPVSSAQAAVALLPGDVDLVVALSNLPEQENDRVARGVPTIPLVLAARGEAYDEPRRVGETLICEVPNRGRYVAVLHARLASGPTQPLDLDTSRDLSLRERDLLSAQIDRQSHDPDRPSPTQESLRQLEKLEAALASGGMGRNLAWWEVVPLGTRFDGDAQVRSDIDRFKKKTIESVKKTIEDERKKAEPPLRYVSGAACVTCHSREFARWVLTDHAKAWESLAKRGETANPECVTCHATGFAVSGGWATITPSTARQYKGVQCEACHGPLEGHPDRRANAPGPVSEATCRPCHDEANSPDFDFERYLPRARCTPAPEDASPVR